MDLWFVDALSPMGVTSPSAGGFGRAAQVTWLGMIVARGGIRPAMGPAGASCWPTCPIGADGSYR